MVGPPRASVMISGDPRFFMPLPSEHNSDLDLLRSIAEGNEDAFESLFRLMFRPVTLYILTLVGDSALAEDIGQETFIKLWKSRGRLSKVENIKSYLYRIAHNEAINRMTKEKRMATEPEMPYREIPANIDIARHIILTETIEQLHNVIETLTPKVKQVFQLYYLDGRSTEEISRLLKTSVNTVMNQRKQALKVIRERFFPG